jgi:hypothetical protein
MWVDWGLVAMHAVVFVADDQLLVNLLAKQVGVWA